MSRVAGEAVAFQVLHHAAGLAVGGAASACNEVHAAAFHTGVSFQILNPPDEPRVDELVAAEVAWTAAFGLVGTTVVWAMLQRSVAGGSKAALRGRQGEARNLLGRKGSGGLAPYTHPRVNVSVREEGVQPLFP